MRTALIVSLQFLLCGIPAAAHTFDVVVYGATGGGVVAAVAAAREGASVALVEPGRFIGGLTAAGWGFVPPSARSVIGGYSREFYQQAGKHYGQEVAWDFEPHVAEAVLRRLLSDAGVAVFLEQQLRDGNSVNRKKLRIRKIVTESGDVFEAKVFVDASYEGDLMAAAKVPYITGREGGFPPETNFAFALCLASDANNRIAFPKPATYDPKRYNPWIDLIARLTTERGTTPRISDLISIQPLPNEKMTAIAATGSPGADYLEATRRKRAEIWQAHMDYTAGLFYFLGNGDSVPDSVRKEATSWGLCADEYAYTNHWPRQLHIRESRRIAGEFVFSWQDVDQVVPDAVGIAHFREKPFPIPYRVLLPPLESVQNLLVVLSPAAGSGIADALRPEYVAMILGHAAGVAAKLAMDAGTPVQDVDSEALRQKLRDQGAILGVAAK